MRSGCVLSAVITPGFYEGCKSWINVPVDWSGDIATPVVRDEEFATRRSQILAAVSPPVRAAA